MIYLDDLRNASALLVNPIHRRYLEILLGRRKGRCHSNKILSKLKRHGLVDRNNKVTLIGIRALDKV